MKRYYVYELVDLRDGAVFYVGKGSGQRMHHHEREAMTGKLSRKCERIRAIVAAGSRPFARVVAWFSEQDEAYRHEEELIAEYGLENLTNVLPKQPPSMAGPGRARGTRNRASVIAEMMWGAARAGNMDELVMLAGKHPAVFMTKVLSRI